MQQAKESVAMSSVLASGAMAVMKLVVGLMTGSLGILSEAAHSLLDLGAASITYFAVRVSDKPADAEHPYGHGKVESVSALIETGLLFVTSAIIIKEAGARLLFGSEEIEVTWYGVAVIVISIIIDIGRSRALMKVAKATGSQALEADALHFSSDILSSTVVLLGLGAVALGWGQADAIAAVGVAMFVFFAGYRLGKRTIDVLMDAAPAGVTERLEAIVGRIEHVSRVARVRVRPAGNILFADVVIKVSRALPFERVGALCAAVGAAIRAEMPEVDPLIHAEPLALDEESINETVRVLAAARGLAVHDIGVQEVGGRQHVNFDIEVDEDLSIGEAHDVATELERAIGRELGGGVVVDTHIDPRRGHIVRGREMAAERLTHLAEKLEAIARTLDLVKGVHNLKVQEGEEGLFFSFHCVFADAVPVRIVHDATARFESAIRHGIPGVARVIVHAEPIRHQDDPLPEAA